LKTTTSATSTNAPKKGAPKKLTTSTSAPTTSAQEGNFTHEQLNIYFFIKSAHLTETTKNTVRKPGKDKFKYDGTAPSAQEPENEGEKSFQFCSC